MTRSNCLIIRPIMPKPDPPVKPTTKVTSVTNNNNKASTISKDDLMAALKSFKVEILSSQKSLSNLQASQYSDLKSALSHVSLQISELKAENSILRTEIDALKEKVVSLEGNSSFEQSQSNFNKFFKKRLNENDVRQIRLPMEFLNLLLWMFSCVLLTTKKHFVIYFYLFCPF